MAALDETLVFQSYVWSTRRYVLSTSLYNVWSTIRLDTSYQCLINWPLIQEKFKIDFQDSERVDHLRFPVWTTNK